MNFVAAVGPSTITRPTPTVPAKRPDVADGGKMTALLSSRSSGSPRTAARSAADGPGGASTAVPAPSSCPSAVGPSSPSASQGCPSRGRLALRSAYSSELRIAKAFKPNRPVSSRSSWSMVETAGAAPVTPPFGNSAIRSGSSARSSGSRTTATRGP
ncbi:hypothetical protein SACE_4964 [Saccharopolyspora erythraea NRRL 2338]|uniref:Uncharacterized protein n=1 Tax=Saccharopolyspora erythraea (strain ATCC 11635 / DSM 40517 / JCM 4748 / NBRC 13426 / NCIMB 8594 / NRRL 2338) TaxID=405948 RepID=A4FJK4_SACEN|nr:hypothetical protein SACE_4964 [Saccharopolyspora erythraea NRRL 2338]